MKKLLTLLLFVAITAGGHAFDASAQSTLFAYPTAPDTCKTLEGRCNYLVQRFWDGCELSKPIKAENDSLLLTAVRDYLEIMMNANVNVSLASVRNLMFKAQSNQSNFLKIAQAAEMLLYMQPTTIIDDVYLAFARSVADATWAEKNVRAHFRHQVKTIEASKLTAPIANFEFTALGGGKSKLYDKADNERLDRIEKYLKGKGHLYNKADTCQSYLLVFTRDDSDGSFARLRLSTDAGLNAAIASGRIKVYDITVGRPGANWAKESADYAKHWTVGNYPDALNVLDIRMLPSVFILDKDHRVQGKNISIDQVKDMFNR